MKYKACFLLALAFWLVLSAKAQRTVSDSAAAAKTLVGLFHLYTDTAGISPVKSEADLHRKAAQYIIYRGEDKHRKWKDFCNYKNTGDRDQIVAICGRIGSMIYQDTAYRITTYDTQHESEGQWHVLTVIFTKNGQKKRFIFAFLKIGNRYGLGDIDKAD